MDLTTTLGTIAGTLTTLAYLPQVLKIWQTKSAAGMSWSMLLILCSGVALWLVYGLYAHDIPVVVANIVTLALSSTILGLKICYEALPQWRNRPQWSNRPLPSLAWGWRR